MLGIRHGQGLDPKICVSRDPLVPTRARWSDPSLSQIPASEWLCSHQLQTQQPGMLANSNTESRAHYLLDRGEDLGGGTPEPPQPARLRCRIAVTRSTGKYGWRKPGNLNGCSNSPVSLGQLSTLSPGPLPMLKIGINNA